MSSLGFYPPGRIERKEYDLFMVYVNETLIGAWRTYQDASENMRRFQRQQSRHRRTERDVVAYV